MLRRVQIRGSRSFPWMVVSMQWTRETSSSRCAGVWSSQKQAVEFLLTEHKGRSVREASNNSGEKIKFSERIVLGKFVSMWREIFQNNFLFYLSLLIIKYCILQFLLYKFVYFQLTNISYVSSVAILALMLPLK